MADTPDFNLKRVSPSRIGKYSECGLAYKLHYIDHVPADTVGSAALFGSVVHKAREEWILDRSADFIKQMEKAWRIETESEPTVRAFIEEYQALSRRACRLEEQIKRARPDIKAVRMTKDWKQSDVARDTNRMLARWLDKLNQSRYRFSERDPLPALYDESLQLAWKYAKRWSHLPNALYSEFAFEFEWNGYTLNGKIDEVGMLLDKDTGELLGYSVEDAKTYRQMPHVFRDSRQLAIYDVAIREYAEKGVLDLDLEKYPVYPVIDLMRLGEKLYYAPVTDSERKRLLSELKMYERGVKAKVFLPAAKSCRADFCDYAAQCAFHHGNQGATVELNVA